MLMARLPASTIHRIDRLSTPCGRLDTPFGLRDTLCGRQWPALKSPVQGLVIGRRGAIVSSVDLRRAAGRPRVLIIDDAEDNRDIYKFFLAHDGFDVEVAADGEAGDALARAIPIIIVTGYPATAAKPDEPAAAWDAYLTKPCLPESLEAEIRRILSVRTA